MKTLPDCVLNHNNHFKIHSLFYRNLLARIAVFYCFMLEGTSVFFVSLGTTLITPEVAYLLTKYGSRFVVILGSWSFILSLPLIAISSTFSTLICSHFLFGLTMGILDISMNNAAILTEVVAGQPLLGSFQDSYSIAAAIGSLLGRFFVSYDVSVLMAFLITMVGSLVLSVISVFHLYDQQQEIYLTTVYNSPTAAVSHDKALHNDHNKEHDDIEATTVISNTNNNNSLAHRIVPAIQQQTIADDNDNKADGSKTATTNSSNSSSLIAFILVGFLAAFGESSIVTWSVVFFDRHLLLTNITDNKDNNNNNDVIKSLGFTCFMVCMALGRFSCDKLRCLLGRRYMFQIAGILACIGMMIVITSTRFVNIDNSNNNNDNKLAVKIACLGFSCTGIGLSTLIPTVFSSLGHQPQPSNSNDQQHQQQAPHHAGSAIALAAGFTYVGSMISSPIVGYISDYGRVTAATAVGDNHYDHLQLAFLIDGLLLGGVYLCSYWIPDETMSSCQQAENKSF